MFPGVGEEVFFFLCDAHLDDLLVKKDSLKAIFLKIVSKRLHFGVILYIFIKKRFQNGADDI